MYSNTKFGTTATFPSEMVTMSSLQSFRTTLTQIGGTIPSWFGALPSLAQLDIDSAVLSGTIPSELGASTSLLRISFTRNQLGGSIPAEIAANPKISSVHLTGNRLDGTIPQEWGAIPRFEDRLLELRLSHNYLVGRVPVIPGRVSCTVFNPPNQSGDKNCFSSCEQEECCSTYIEPCAADAASTPCDENMFRCFTRNPDTLMCDQLVPGANRCVECDTMISGWRDFNATSFPSDGSGPIEISLSQCQRFGMRQVATNDVGSTQFEVCTNKSTLQGLYGSGDPDCKRPGACIPGSNAYAIRQVSDVFYVNGEVCGCNIRGQCTQPPSPTPVVMTTSNLAPSRSPSSTTVPTLLTTSVELASTLSVEGDETTDGGNSGTQVASTAVQGTLAATENGEEQTASSSNAAPAAKGNETTQVSISNSTGEQMTSAPQVTTTDEEGSMEGLQASTSGSGSISSTISNSSLSGLRAGGNSDSGNGSSSMMAAQADESSNQLLIIVVAVIGAIVVLAVIGGVTACCVTANLAAHGTDDAPIALNSPATARAPSDAYSYALHGSNEYAAINAGTASANYSNTFSAKPSADGHDYMTVDDVSPNTSGQSLGNPV